VPRRGQHVRVVEHPLGVPRVPLGAPLLLVVGRRPPTRCRPETCRPRPATGRAPTCPSPRARGGSCPSPSGTRTPPAPAGSCRSRPGRLAGNGV
jgi:hypothetical protein